MNADSKKIQSIIESVIKWNGICSQCHPAYHGTMRCSLCREYEDTDKKWGEGCRACPLDIFGHGCSRSGNAWSNYFDMYHHGSAADIIDAAEEMYEAVCELAIHHGIEIDVRGFEKESELWTTS